MKIDNLISELEDVKEEHGNTQLETTNYAHSNIFGIRVLNEDGKIIKQF